MKSTVLYIFLFCFLFMASSIKISAQNSNNQTYKGKNIPKFLLAKISLTDDKLTLDKFLARIDSLTGVKLNYNKDRLPMGSTIRIKIKTGSIFSILIHALNQLDIDLIINEQNQLILVKVEELDTGSIEGFIYDSKDNSPLLGSNVLISGTIRGAATNQEGYFSIENIDPGIYTVIINYIGFESKVVKNVLITPGTTYNISTSLKEKSLLLQEITVTPGKFAITSSNPSIQTLIKKDIPTFNFGEDIYRAVTKLPGISSTDFSAQFNIRGGEEDETLTILDGMELYTPFHMKEFLNGIFSVIDIASIGKVDLLTGGFTAEYGNKSSGVFNINTIEPTADQKRVELGLSVMNGRFMSCGTFDDEKGTWLFSARRGYIDFAVNFLDTDRTPVIIYYDFLNKFSYKLSDKHTISFHILHSGDKSDMTKDNIEAAHYNYNYYYLWTKLKSVFSDKLLVNTMLSSGIFDQTRNGFINDSNGFEFGWINNKTNYSFWGMKQDLVYQHSEDILIKAGLDYKYAKSNYLYQNWMNLEYMDEDYVWKFRKRHININYEPSGLHFGMYISTRLHLSEKLTAEIGGRYDYTSIVAENMFSPRVNIEYKISPYTSFRTGWGHYYQSQNIMELRVEHGEETFQKSKFAEHFVAGIEHSTLNGWNFRLESYYKKYNNLWPVYRDIQLNVPVIAELEWGQVIVDPKEAISKGLELYVKYDNQKWYSFWASYSYSKIEEEAESVGLINGSSLNYSATYPRPFDQRHTLYLDLNIRPIYNWNINLSYRYHSGWPYTGYDLKTSTRSDGSESVYFQVDRYLNERLPSYNSIDLRVTKKLLTSYGSFTFSLEMINFFNLKNTFAYTYEKTLQRDGTYRMNKNASEGFPFLPSFGITWTYNL